MDRIKATSRGKTLGELIGVRCQPEILDEIDRWRRKQADLPGRPEAIRRLVAAALHMLAKAPAEKPPSETGPRARRAADASALAGQEIDRLGDESAPVAEREKRKRRLVKGPSEFREMRGDLPRPKR
jgi:hypothetical protein